MRGEQLDVPEILGEVVLRAGETAMFPCLAQRRDGLRRMRP